MTGSILMKGWPHILTDSPSDKQTHFYNFSVDAVWKALLRKDKKILNHRSWTKTRPNTWLLKSRANGQGQLWKRLIRHLSRGKDAKRSTTPKNQTTEWPKDSEESRVVHISILPSPSASFLEKIFIVAVTQLYKYKRLSTTISPSVVASGMIESKSGKTSGVYGVRCPCPPVCNDIMTPRHFFQLSARAHSAKSSKRDLSLSLIV